MDNEMSAALVADLEKSEAILKKMVAERDGADAECDALLTALASVQTHLQAERKVLAALQDDVEPMNDTAEGEAVEDEADAIVARAPMMACTYLLRASAARPGCIEYRVEGHGEWTSYPLEYYQSRDMTSPFPQMWKCAGAADRRRLLAEVRAAA